MGSIFIRTVIIYIVVVTCVRLMGKRQVGELQPSELVVAIMISEVASISLQDTDIPLIFGVIPVLTLVSLEMIIAFFSLKNRRFRKLISGNPCLVIENGVIDQRAVRKLRISIDDIMEELRINGITSIEDVQYAYIETNGQLSIIERATSAPPSAQDMKVPVKPIQMPRLLIADGVLIRTEFRAAGLNEEWLQKLLQSEGLSSVREVFALWRTDDGTVNLVKKEENK